MVKLGIAIGAMREGAVHSSVRKALASGITKKEVDQVIALAAGTLGLGLVEYNGTALGPSHRR